LEYFREICDFIAPQTQSAIIKLSSWITALTVLLLKIEISYILGHWHKKKKADFEITASKCLIFNYCFSTSEALLAGRRRYNTGSFFKCPMCSASVHG
jgi:hypothetical protein